MHPKEKPELKEKIKPILDTKLFTDRQSYENETKSKTTHAHVPLCYGFPNSPTMQQFEALVDELLEESSRDSSFTFTIYLFPNLKDDEAAKDWLDKNKTILNKLEKSQKVTFEEYKKIHSNDWEKAKTVYNEKVLIGGWSETHHKHLQTDANRFVNKWNDKIIQELKKRNPNLNEEEIQKLAKPKLWTIEESIKHIKEETIFNLSLCEQMNSDDFKNNDFQLTRHTPLFVQHNLFESQGHVHGSAAQEIMKYLGYKPNSLPKVMYGFTKNTKKAKCNNDHQYSDNQDSSKLGDTNDLILKKAEEFVLKMALNGVDPDYAAGFFVHSLSLIYGASPQRNPSSNFKNGNTFFENKNPNFQALKPDLSRKNNTIPAISILVGGEKKMGRS